jgi:hypothetical protein
LLADGVDGVVVEPDDGSHTTGTRGRHQLATAAYECDGIGHGQTPGCRQRTIFAEAMPGHCHRMGGSKCGNLRNITGEGCHEGQRGGYERWLRVLSGSQRLSRPLKAELTDRPAEGMVGEGKDVRCGRTLATDICAHADHL